MCKSQSATKASQPNSRHRSKTSSASTAPSSSGAAASSSSSGTRTDPGSRARRQPPASISSGSSLSSKPYTSSSSSSALSLASLRSSLPEAPALYSFPELCAATNNFLAKRLPGASSSAWRCTLRGRDAVVIQRPLRRRLGSGHPDAALRARLAALGRSHHSSLARLLGASLADDHVYLVYEFVPGASLADCLHNPRNPRFTPLATWASRVQVAADVAHGLEYIHQHSSAAAGVHNRVKSSAVIVTEPDFRAKICHFGAADLAGEVPDPAAEDAEITPVLSPSSTRKGSSERQRKIEGTTGYMAPEVLAQGAVSRRSDVFAFGVTLLEMISGEEPLKYRYDKERKAFDVFSLIETAREAIGVASEGDEEEERWGRVRRWVDRRLRDSFPVEAAEKLIRVALRCVETEAAARPDMTWVAGKISKAYLVSKVWAEKVRIPTDFSVSTAPR
ncbi:Protein tyrosine kinase [Musa troglodytarum]|uniref:Protein tyrosine kinase n=1 Tax=Musa troglodytarum TaxID=320322 RepID=A0A9E7GLJ8_9LILI|nr:Protein tyrosine kinase [Musa troglodytarum]